MWGRRDPYVPSNLAAAQRQAFPDAELHVLPGAAHWPFVDEPGTVAALFDRFLRKLD